MALRELHVWNCSGSCARLLHGGIPIGLRIALSVGTSCAVRALAWRRRGMVKVALLVAPRLATRSHQLLARLRLQV